MAGLLNTSSYGRAGICGDPCRRLSAWQSRRLAMATAAIAQIRWTHVAVCAPHIIRTQRTAVSGSHLFDVLWPMAQHSSFVLEAALEPLGTSVEQAMAEASVTVSANDSERSEDARRHPVQAFAPPASCARRSARADVPVPAAARHRHWRLRPGCISSGAWTGADSSIFERTPRQLIRSANCASKISLRFA